MAPVAGTRPRVTLVWTLAVNAALPARQSVFTTPPHVLPNAPMGRACALPSHTAETRPRFSTLAVGVLPHIRVVPPEGPVPAPQLGPTSTVATMTSDELIPTTAVVWRWTRTTSLTYVTLHVAASTPWPAWTEAVVAALDAVRVPVGLQATTTVPLTSVTPEVPTQVVLVGRRQHGPAARHA